MSLSRSTYYHKSKNESEDDGKLIAQIEGIIEDFPGYGYRRVTQELHRRDIPVNHKKVLRIMRQRGLLRKTKRRWIRTTNSDHNNRVYPNLIKNLIVTGPNQVWAADIHLYCDSTWFCVFGRYPGFVCQKSHWLCYFP